MDIVISSEPEPLSGITTALQEITSLVFLSCIKIYQAHFLSFLLLLSNGLTALAVNFTGFEKCHSSYDNMT